MNKNLDLTFPDIITVINASLGFLAITYIIDGRLWISSIIIIFCVGIDGLDGALARYLGVQHKLGSYLDFFSDMISFCFAPALLLYYTFYDLDLGRGWESPQNALATLVPFMIVFLGTLRLARFADDTSEEKTYRGLPTPSLALLILNFSYLFGWGELNLHLPFTSLVSIGLLSLLLYSKIDYPKFRKLKTQIGGGFFLLIVLIAFILTETSFGLGDYIIGSTTLLLLGYVFISPIIVKIYDKE